VVTSGCIGWQVRRVAGSAQPERRPHLPVGLETYETVPTTDASEKSAHNYGLMSAHPHIV
jgi:hypothetical protein